MAEKVYERLISYLIQRNSAFPIVDCPEFQALIVVLFTAEQAELAALLPPGLCSAAEISSQVGRPREEVTPILESMADEGLVIAVERGGEMKYKLLDVFPGFFEYKFMKGTTTDRDKLLGRLFKSYLDRMYENLRNLPEPLKKVTPPGRVIQIEKETAAGTVVHPYETISKYIDDGDYISVAHCYCRHHGELLGNPCEHSKETCMAFGPNARFAADRGFGRMISKQEAKEILDKAEEEGLVHLGSNTSKHIDFICNCCPCHCAVIQSLSKSSLMPNMAVVSNFEPVISEDDCVGCGDCVDKCPMDALTLEDETARIDRARCIGCGVCNGACPSEALSMKRRADADEPPLNKKALGLKVMESLQKAMNEMQEKTSD
jgi:formate hydrogenlyase subunit 6/NADH:ubiquinone oxidoreductase subunit I